MSSLSIRNEQRDLLAGMVGPPAARRLALAALTVCTLAVAGPGGAWRLPGLDRLAEVASCTLGWEVCAPPIIGFVRRRMGEARFATSPWPFALAILLASVPATACMVVAFRLAGDTVPFLPLLYGQSVLLGLVIAFARRGLFGVSTTATAQADDGQQLAPGIEPGTLFLRRHAPRLAKGRLLALEAEDHYLRVHTDRGSTLILMRLRDAAEALGPSAGWQPHRSFWLAAGAEAEVQRHGQSWRLVLPTGLVVPVSRQNVGAMRDAGHRPRSG